MTREKWTIFLNGVTVGIVISLMMVIVFSYL